MVELIIYTLIEGIKGLFVKLFTHFCGYFYARMAKMVDASDLNSDEQ